MATMFWWVLPGKSLCIPTHLLSSKTFLDLQAFQSKAFSLLLIFPHFFFSYIMFVFFTHCFCCCSVTQLCLTLRDPRLPCPSLSPGVFSNSCPLSRWCHPTMSSSVIPFSSCPQSFPASGSFPISRLFASGGQSLLHSLNDKSLLSLVNSRYYYGSFEIALNSKSKYLCIL